MIGERLPSSEAKSVRLLTVRELMSLRNYDDPAQEEKWCDERRTEVIAFLKREGVVHGRVGDWPAWHVAPYVSIWAIESAKRPEGIGWWVICGDLPTDYVSADAIKHPRDAMRALSQRWIKVSEHMARGEEHPAVSIGTPDSRPTLGPLLRSRAETLSDWVDDDEAWEDQAP